MHAVVFLLGCLVLFCVGQDAFEVMLLPRRIRRRIRLVSILFSVTWGATSSVARRIPLGDRREQFLSLYGPLCMMMLFMLWEFGLIAAFGMLEWATQANGSLASQLYMSGVTFFTLGYGDVVPTTSVSRFLAVLEAGSGLGVVAVVISYLPVLYQFFSRREAHVIQLDGRAGSPPTATTLLCRHADAGGLAGLEDLLREWEIWGSELLESHLSYPVLAYYRSQHANQSWLAALAAVMDTCALVLVGVEAFPLLQARMTFTMARQVLVEMARSFDVSPSRYSGGDRLPHAAFLRMEMAFSDAGLKWSGGAEAEEILSGLRATYEPLLDGLSTRLLLPLQGWIADSDTANHWAAGPRGLIAQQLIEKLSQLKPGLNANLSDPAGEELLWRRLRARLRNTNPDQK
jgi:hypothetical protein